MPNTLPSPYAIASRKLGSMLGMVVGDALGASYEFLKVRTPVQVQRGTTTNTLPQKTHLRQ